MMHYNDMNEMNAMRMCAMLAEDVGAPELRNPKYSGMRPAGWIGRILAKVFRG